MPDSLQHQLLTALGPGYTIERELGGGGMSRVFVAREVALDRDVVVKVLAPELAEGLSAERFAREIRLAAALQEPHIVPVFAAGATVEGLPFYMMPFVRGESLRARMAGGRVPAAEAARILRDIAQALAYAHGLGVVHRDIKPENVLLSSGTAVVTDFGIAKALQVSKTSAPGGTLTQLGTSLGTPAYMAPEQAAADPATDHRADLYAWGVVAYELLGGQHPFAGRTSPQQLMAAHFSETPAPFATSGGAISRTVRALVMRCLAKDPLHRPASADELLAVLDGAATTPERPARSRRARVIAGVALGVALLAGAALAWRSRRSLATAEAATPIMLAVLPFEHVGPADQEPFTDGLTDEVTAKLGRLPELAVIDRRSAAQYRRTPKAARQIGSELGVAYLVQGMVRWAKDGKGAWRAQVTPTLVDARAGTTKWTGESVVITPDDPFTAQAVIATKVAEALQLALRPADRAGLARRMTENPAAFAAYQRGIALFLSPSARSLDILSRSAEELERAVALDSSFADAWASLAGNRMQAAIYSPGDRAADSVMRAAFRRAIAHAPDHPLLLQALAYRKLFFDHDTVGVDALVSRGIASAPNDAMVLSVASAHLFYRQQLYDSAYALARRAVMLDPRSATPLLTAALIAAGMRRWNDADRYADALTALDPASEQGWRMRLAAGEMRGDTLAVQRDLTQLMARLPQQSHRLLRAMAYAGGTFVPRFTGLTTRDLRVSTLADSVTSYYGARADAFTNLGDTARARLQYDSIRTLLTGRALSGFFESQLLSYLALAQASLGQPAEARTTLARSLSIARSSSARPDLSDVLASDVIAGIYARLGEPEKAVQWLEMAVTNPGGGWTAQGFAIRPKLLPLRGTPAFARFLRDHPR